MIPMGKPERRPQAPPPTIPQATLYIRNLNEKLKEKTIQVGLETIFSTFGTIVDIRVKKNIRHRGQAFVSFDSIESATEAMTKAQGFPLFEKPMDIQYAREPAFAVSSLDGPAKLEAHRKRRAQEKVSKKVKADQTGDAKPKKKVGGDDNLPPNAILFVQNLPKDTTEATLVGMFSQFPGFKEVRLVPGKSDIAFVEYDTDGESSVAKQSLHGYRISADKEIKVTFAKK
ncbi:U2 small nuclear ribonucleoprotein B [Globomyces pollinis-pini]|nr:U2 small nuclear ribonucleoprotein B [Globomyces pollinis-pini]